MKKNEQAQIRAAFASIVAAALIVAALAFAIEASIDDIAVTYNASINQSTFVNISNTGNSIVGITNSTANNFFGNQTSTSGTSVIDRTISSAYGSILIIGQVPSVFVTSVTAIFSGIGLTGYEKLVIAFITATIVGIGLYLAFGRA